VTIATGNTARGLLSQASMATDVEILAQPRKGARSKCGAFAALAVALMAHAGCAISAPKPRAPELPPEVLATQDPAADTSRNQVIASGTASPAAGNGLLEFGIEIAAVVFQELASPRTAWPR
jgi:hypothetical protein